MTTKQQTALAALRKASANSQRDLFFLMLKHAKLPTPEPEVRFHDDRMWRFDYAWREQKVALEVDGGAFSGGRHTRGKGFINDMEKLNAAVVLGWRVVRCVPSKLTSASTEEMLRRLLR